jgi:outer membrane protein
MHGRLLIDGAGYDGTTSRSGRTDGCRLTCRYKGVEGDMEALIKFGMFALLLGVTAAQAGDFKVGVVDTERILRESVPAMIAENKIEKEFSGRDNDIKKLAREAKELQVELAKEDSKLSDTDRRNKERELAAMNADLQRVQREFREDLNLRKNEELASVLEQANKAIQTIAESEKYDLILQEAVYRNPKIDITDKVIKYLADNKSDGKSGSKADDKADNKAGK